MTRRKRIKPLDFQGSDPQLALVANATPTLIAFHSSRCRTAIQIRLVSYVTCGRFGVRLGMHTERGRRLLSQVEEALALADELGADMVGIHLDTARVAVVRAIGTAIERQAELQHPSSMQ